MWGRCFDSKKSRRKLFSGFFSSEFLVRGGRGGAERSGLSPYAATALILPLSPGHNDITRFRPWSPIVRGNHFDRAEVKNFQKLLRRLAPLTFFIRTVILGPASRRAAPCPNIHE